MKRLLIFCVLNIFLSFASLAWAEELAGYNLGQVVISESRIEESLGQIGSSGTVITAEELEKRGINTVKKALTEVVGIDVAASGDFGGPTSVYVRGANTGQTLVMIDGVKIYDPISTDASFDLANLAIDNIERIEIIRGPQSSLYGSDAMGGVINIITKKGQGEPKVKLSFEGGSYNTFQERIGSSGKIDKLGYSFEVSRKDSKGISKAAEKDGNVEKDGYENTSGSIHLDYDLSDTVQMGLYGYSMRAKFDIDDSGGAGGDDENRVDKTEQVLISPYINHDLTDWWQHSLKVSWLKSMRHDDDENNGFLTDYLRSWYKGENLALDWQHNFELSDWDTVVGGFQYNQEKGKSYYYSETVFGPYEDNLPEKKADNKGYYLENKLNLEEVFFNTLAIRIDDHSRFKEQFTWRATAAYLTDKGTKFKGTYGTGYKAPSLYQLFSSYGDENLKPEENEGYDIGIEQAMFNDKVFAGAVYFHNNFEALIDYDFVTSKYKNINNAKTEGVEAEIAFIPYENLATRLSYTYLEAKNETDDEPLLRRAKNKFNLNVNYAPVEKLNINLNVGYFKGRYDKTGFPVTLVKLKDYTKIDLTVSYRLNQNIEFFARAENLTDEDYEEVSGYGTRGQSFYGGVKVNF